MIFAQETDQNLYAGSFILLEQKALGLFHISDHFFHTKRNTVGDPLSDPVFIGKTADPPGGFHGVLGHDGHIEFDNVRVCGAFPASKPPIPIKRYEEYQHLGNGIGDENIRRR